MRALLLAALLAAGAPTAFARTPVEPDSVKSAVLLAWDDHGPAGASLDIRNIPKLYADDGEYSLEVALPEDCGRPGPRVVPVTCFSDGRQVSRGLASVVITAECAVFVAGRALSRGEEILEGDYTATTQTLEKESGRFFAPIAGARYRAMRDLAEGAVLRPGDVRRIPDVNAGDAITLVSAAGKARAAIAGKVRRPGNIGDTILVLNPVSGALVRAVLVDVHTAELIPVPAPFVRKERNS